MGFIQLPPTSVIQSLTQNSKVHLNQAEITQPNHHKPNLKQDKSTAGLKNTQLCPLGQSYLIYMVQIHLGVLLTPVGKPAGSWGSVCCAPCLGNSSQDDPYSHHS